MGIIVTGMQDATARVKLEKDRRHRTALAAKYFGLKKEQVEARLRCFSLLDVDQSESLSVEELQETMAGLEVPYVTEFLVGLTADFLDGEDWIGTYHD